MPKIAEVYAVPWFACWGYVEQFFLVSIVENDHGWFRQLKMTMASLPSWLVSIVEDDCG